MCSCELHQSYVGNCTCVCDAHDRYFDSGVVILRKAIRSLNDRLYSLGQEVANLPQPVEATLEVADDNYVRGISASVDRLIDRVTAIENHDLNKILDRLDKMEDRLSPPETKTGLSEASIRAMEATSLPPDMWDRFGVRWTCKGRYGNNDLLWESVQKMPLGRERIVTIRGTDLEASGPFTSKSPLAEDQEPMPDASENKDVDPADPLYKYKRPHTPRDTCGPLCNHEVYETESREPSGEAKDVDPRQPYEDIASLAEGRDQRGIWAEPWEPQGDIAEMRLFDLALSAVHDATHVLEYDPERLRWIAAGLVRQIEKRYQLVDQPAYANDKDWQRIKAFLDDTEESRPSRQVPSIVIEGPGVKALREAMCRVQSQTWGRAYDADSAASDVRRIQDVIDACDRYLALPENTGPEHDTSQSDSWVCARCGESPEAHASESSTCVYEPRLVSHEHRYIGRPRMCGVCGKPEPDSDVDENGIDWKMRATAAETELAIAREEDVVTDRLLHMGHGVKQESDGEFLAKLGTDAVKWAKEFTRICDGGQVFRGVSPEQDHDKPLDVDESLMTTWFASAIGAGESKNGVALDYLRYLAGENYREKATEWFENYYGTPSYRPPGPGGLIEDWGNRMRDLEAVAASPPAQETFVAAIPMNDYTANADRIRLAKDALVATGYFTEGQVDDDIAPRITELVEAHNEGFRNAMADMDKTVNQWKDRAIVAERRLASLKRIVADVPKYDDEPIS